LPEGDYELASFAIYLAGQARDTRAFPLLCAAARHPTRLDDVLGDGVTEDLEAIFVRTFDGDAAGLKAVVEEAGAGDFVREAALSAMAILTVDGRIPRDTMRDYIAWLFENLQPREEHFLWFGVQNAVAVLGLAELAPRAMQLFEDGWVSETISTPEEFQEDLDNAAASENPLDAVHPDIGENIGRLDGIVGYMETWAYYLGEDGDEWQDEELDDEEPVPGDRSVSDGRPYVNPYRNVGRNDPCPCGSGKKFKKCCLGAAPA
jgi:hypothetical protein